MIPKNITNPELHLLASRSRSALKSRAKTVAREHADRIKKIEKVIQTTENADPSRETNGLDGINISPEMEQLILNPTKGL